MHFAIDPSAPAPPSEQIADQVRFAVAAGRLRVGDQLPPVRALAAQARVNPNTVSRAWRALEHEGVVESRRGEGVFLTKAAPRACRRKRDLVIAERLGRTIAEARAAGLGEAEVLELVQGALAGWRVMDPEEVPQE